MHDVNLLTALELGRQAGAVLPVDDRITLVAIEAADTSNFGEDLTPEVAAAIPQAIEIVLQMLELAG